VVLGSKLFKRKLIQEYMASDEELRQKYEMYQHLQQKIQEIHSHVEQIQEQEIHLIGTKEAIKEMSSVEEGTELRVPIANGIFFSAKMNDSKKFIVNVGNNVVVEKSLDETKTLLDEQHSNMKEMREKLLARMEVMAKNLKDLEEELTKAVEQDVQVSEG